MVSRCVCQSAPVRALVVPVCCERGVSKKSSSVELNVSTCGADHATAGPAALLSAAHRMACLSLATFVFWLLVLQNAGVVLLMRYTRATRGESDYVPQV